MVASSADSSLNFIEDWPDTAQSKFLWNLDMAMQQTPGIRDGCDLKEDLVRSRNRFGYKLLSLVSEHGGGLRDITRALRAGGLRVRAGRIEEIDEMYTPSPDRAQLPVAEFSGKIWERRNALQKRWEANECPL